VDYRAALRLKDSLSQTGRFLRSIDLARTRFRTTESAISDSMLMVSRAKDTALAAGNTTNTGTSRDALRIQVEQIFDQLLSHANTRAPGGGYVFSGIASDTKSFVQVGNFVSGSPPPTVSFAGDASVIDVEIDEGVFVDVTRDGAQVFQGAVDVFAVLGELWTGIDTGDLALIQGAQGDLDQAFANLSIEQSHIGGAESKADSFEARHESQEVELTSQISLLQDVDVFEVYSSLVTQEAALQGSLEVTSRLLAPTLLDFI
jgi:flagellar hook-associated protein 3 FlgL